MNRPDIRALFDRIAPMYDAMNERISYGRQRVWKRALVRDAEKSGGDALDLCCGTGDIALMLAQTGRFSTVTGLDFSAGMLRIAAGRAGADNVRFLKADASGRLPFPDDGFATAVVSFGLRNLPDPAATLGELFRILQPGGRLYVLDACRAVGPLARLTYWIQYRLLFPLLTRKDRADYDWLRRSSEGFWSLTELRESSVKAGFLPQRARQYALGLAMYASFLKEDA